MSDPRENEARHLEYIKSRARIDYLGQLRHWTKTMVDNHLLRSDNRSEVGTYLLEANRDFLAEATEQENFSSMKDLLEMLGSQVEPEDVSAECDEVQKQMLTEEHPSLAYSPMYSSLGPNESTIKELVARVRIGSLMSRYFDKKDPVELIRKGLNYSVVGVCQKYGLPVPEKVASEIGKEELAEAFEILRQADLILKERFERTQDLEYMADGRADEELAKHLERKEQMKRFLEKFSDLDRLSVIISNSAEGKIPV